MPKSRRSRRSDDLVHKQLLKFKAIVALILKLCCPEFRNLPLREIEQRIEMPSDLGNKPVHASPFIRGENIEVTDDETQTLFDSLFTAKSDFGMLRINIEVQKAFYPGYDIDNRGFYYVARVISAEKGSGVFTSANYNGLQKVYSIWLMLNPPKKYAGMLDIQHLIKKRYNSTGSLVEVLEDDPVKSKLCFVKVYLPQGDSAREDADPMNILGVTFRNPQAAENKKTFLEKNGILVNEQLNEVLKEMRSYEDVLRNMGLKEGLEKGRKEGQEEALEKVAKNLLSLGLSIDVIKKATNLPQAVIEKLTQVLPSSPATKFSTTA